VRGAWLQGKGAVGRRRGGVEAGRAGAVIPSGRRGAGAAVRALGLRERARRPAAANGSRCGFTAVIAEGRLVAAPDGPRLSR